MASGILFTRDASRTRKVYVWMALPLIAASYYAVDHRFDASLFVEAATGIQFDGSENLTADRSEGVNAGSSTFRLLLAAFGCVGLAYPNGQKLNWRSPMLWSVGAYTAYLLSSVLWSVGPEYTLFKLTVVAVFMLAALGISRQIRLDELGRMFSLTCVGFILLGVLVEIYLHAFLAREDYRFTGTSHPNTQAAYGAIVCLGAVLFGHHRQRISTVAVMIFAVGFGCLLLTKSRTSLAAMLLGLIAMQGLRTRGNNRILLVAGALSALAVGSLMISLLGAQFKSSLGSAAAMGRTDDITSLTGRLPLWEELMDTVAESPWVGHGYMAFWTPDRVEYLGDLFKWEIPHGHNMYLDVLIDGGVIGLFLFVSMYLVGLVTAARTYSRTDDDGAAFAFGLLVFAMVHGVGESFFKQYALQNFVLITVLLRFAWMRRNDEQAALTTKTAHESTSRTLVASGVA